ncbi:MAG TPA: PHP-associated domain-containing protein [Acidimicrobiales bacterium]|jgi:predicted metal-dependent phosphoesterase TrpH|nr:PHP-associated domain-containing protein [Acidimicrobiales bacterium]|tara:strand:- start:1379 stop:2026 length:648 start_codon:yes stop_codon:yes gene_type:complete
MLLDLHTHSVKSDDGRAKVENYCKWIRKKELPLDGFVLTEHRQFDEESDYRHLEDEYDLLILKASEVETDFGHVLVFGVNDDLLAALDFSDIRLPIDMVLTEAERCGAFAAPCHPGRKRVGLFSHYEEQGIVDAVHTVEVLNGGSIPGEDEWSLQRAKDLGYRGFGGSDSHVVSRIGFCATEFPNEIITSVGDLVDALTAGNFQPISLRTETEIN